MLISRKIDLSMYYYLKGLLPSLVNVYDGYPVDKDGRPSGDLTLPAVAVERQPIILRPFELAGNRLAHYFYIMDIYGLTKAQRDDIAYTIQTDLDSNNVRVYDYDEGFPPSVSPSHIGTLVIDSDIRNTVVYVFPELSPTEYWRAVVDFAGYYSAI
jgi:hypothetical protein